MTLDSRCESQTLMSVFDIMVCKKDMGRQYRYQWKLPRVTAARPSIGFISYTLSRTADVIHHSQSNVGGTTDVERLRGMKDDDIPRSIVYVSIYEVLR